MNFNYSYRAFLITSLLFGILFLLLYSIKLSGNEEEVVDNDIEYLDLEELFPEEEELVAISTENVKIETNRAYNQAEKFISEIENDRRKTTEEESGKTEEEINNEKKKGSSGETGTVISYEKPQSKETFSNGKNNSKETSVTNSANRRTTISYHLVDRKALDLPNPVYTCEGAGKIVINIEVDSAGRPKKTSYNEKASTTTDECLIDEALKYASEALFTTDGSKKNQLGTITYNFPGQE